MEVGGKVACSGSRKSRQSKVALKVQCVELSDIYW